MIIIRLVGGIGNQLFQIIGAMELAKFRNQELVFDVSIFKKNGDDFGRFPVEKLLSFMGFKIIRLSNYELFKMKLYDFIIRKERCKKRIYENENLEDPYNLFLVSPYKQIVFSYFGFPFGNKFIPKIKESLYTIYNLERHIHTISDELNKYGNYNKLIAVHIRRMDYLNAQNIYLNLLDNTDYYQLIFNKLSIKYKDCKFVIFSDDLTINKHLCKFNFKFNFIFFNEFLKKNNFEISDVEELLVISTFSDIVIANSTFSSWAAMLSETNSTVYFPKIWYSNLAFQRRQDNQNIEKHCQNWECIEFSLI